MKLANAITLVLEIKTLVWHSTTGIFKSQENISLTLHLIPPCFNRELFLLLKTGGVFVLLSIFLALMGKITNFFYF